MSETDELDKILFNLARAGFSSGFSLDPSTDDDWYSSDEEDVDEAKAAIQAYISKELKAVIGDDIPEDWDDELDSVQNWQYYDDYKSNAYDFVNGYNKARVEQRQRARAKGYDV